MDDSASEEKAGFLSRWARRKQQVRSGVGVEAEPQREAAPVVEATLPAPAAEPAASIETSPPTEPLPTMADVALLTRESDYARFVGAGVDNGVKQAAMRKLFTDPHFNVMDGLDTYIDDYGRPDPIPVAMLRQMNQSKFLRLFDDDDEDDAEAPVAASLTASLAPVPVHEPSSPPDDHADLQLQPDDVAGQPGPDRGAGA